MPLRVITIGVSINQPKKKADRIRLMELKQIARISQKMPALENLICRPMR
jgi:hypothetical protein